MNYIKLYIENGKTNEKETNDKTNFDKMSKIGEAG